MQLIFPLVPLFLNHRKTAIFTSFIPTQLLAFLRVYPILFVLCNPRIISHFLLSFLICLPTTHKHMSNTQSLSMMPSLICPVIKIIFYLFLLLCCIMLETGRVFPWEGLSPDSKRSQKVQILIHGIKKSLIMKMKYILQKLHSFILFFLIIFIVSFELYRGKKRFLK